MRLTRISIQNFRSIRKSGNVRIEPLQALVGENNCGKSNILRAIKCFLSSGTGGMELDDFNDRTVPAVIECEFSGLSQDERQKLRSYLIGDRIILRKELEIVRDEAKNRDKIETQYHGYQAEPVLEHLSIKKILANHGNRPAWDKIGAAGGILNYVTGADGKVNKGNYETGLVRYLAEHDDVEYEQPVVGQTQALGIPQNLLAALPEFFLLPAITDYSDEVDRRSTSTVFRRLMADLADRILKNDPRYQQLDDALAHIRTLLNKTAEDQNDANRLAALGTVETSLRDTVKKLMPGVQSVRLGVEVETSTDIFSKGVNIRIDDGVLTDVLDKGHGLQRSLIFALLQMLIKSGRNDQGAPRPIILGIEEPELYIHPHCQRLVFRVLRDFAGITDDDAPAAGSDQVIYTTHSPALIEVWNYQRIGLVRKPDLPTGTVVRQAARGVLGNGADQKSFKQLTCFSLKHNEVFFAKEAVLVEGPEDEIALIATARKMNRIRELFDEIGVSVIVAHGKQECPKFLRILNAFGIPYGVLCELDGRGEQDPQSAAVLAHVGAGNRLQKVPNRVEDLVGAAGAYVRADGHFKDTYYAQEFFSDSLRINAALETVVGNLLPPP